MKNILALTAAGLALAFASASAQDTPYYLKASAGLVLMSESANSGRATEAFQPGLIDATLAPGGAYIFDSRFEVGTYAAIAGGKTTPFGPFRSEVELIHTRTGLKDHNNFTTLGQDLVSTDVAVLLGLDAPVGITTGNALGDAQGAITTVGAMVNYYQDIIVPAENVRPYWGRGFGPTWVNVDYSPSGSGLVEDSDGGLGFHLSAGCAYDFNERNALVSGFRYLNTTEITVQTDEILSSNLNVQAKQTVFELAWQRSF